MSTDNQQSIGLERKVNRGATLAPQWKSWLKSTSFAIWAQSSIKCWKLRALDHNEVYGEDYYRMVDETTGKSAHHIAKSIVQHLQPKRVIDMGCGTGNLIAELNSFDVETTGLEFAKAALAYCQSRQLNVRPFDFTNPADLAQSLGEFDLAISLEVAIQLPARAALSHIALLCNQAPVVLFSSPPCANDRRPQSPQPAEFWIRKFSTHGFRLDTELSQLFKTNWEKAGTASWFYREPMLFRKQT